MDGSKKYIDTSTAQANSVPVVQCCFTCQQMRTTTQAISVCEDCDILLCEACCRMHIATPIATNHVISFLEVGSIKQVKEHKEICKEHNCLVEFCCKDCQKAVCNKCCIVYHRKCNTVVTLDSMIPEMKQALQKDYDKINSHLQHADNTLNARTSEVEEIAQDIFSLQSEIRRVSQQAVDLIRRKEKKLLDELDKLTEKQTGKLKGQIKSRRLDLQAYQQYNKFIKKALLSNSPVDMYDMCTLCQSEETIAEIQRKEKHWQRIRRLEFVNQLDVNKLDRRLEIGSLKFKEDMFNSLDKPKLLSKINIRAEEDIFPELRDIEIFHINGKETMVLTDCKNSSVKSFYTENDKPCCTSLKLAVPPLTLAKISRDRVAVSHVSHNSIELIKLTPDPFLVSSIKTKKQYRCLTSLSDGTLAAGCEDPPSIDVLGLSGRVLRSVITTSRGQQVIHVPWYICTTRQDHIMVTDGKSDSVFCVTQQGEVLYKHELTGGDWLPGGVTTTDTGSVIVADTNGHKIVQLKATGGYVRDLLTGQDGKPMGMRVHGNKLYVTELKRKHVKIFSF